MLQTGKVKNNVAGINPTPAYKDIVYTESVIVNLFIIIRHTDQSKVDMVTIIEPNWIDILGLRTISVPINPIIKVVILRILKISLRNKTENILVNIGIVNPNAVVSLNEFYLIQKKNKEVPLNLILFYKIVDLDF